LGYVTATTKNLVIGESLNKKARLNIYAKLFIIYNFQNKIAQWRLILNFYIGYVEFDLNKLQNKSI